MCGNELDYINEAHNNGRLSGDGPFTARCHRILEQDTGTTCALLTHSCTAALEMCCMLAELGPGDEVIMPSFTFVSTANAVVQQGATPVFVDIRKDTLNIDETLVEAALTRKTKAILAMHYAGVACEMDTLCDISSRHNILLIEDAAQGIKSHYKGMALGSIGDLGTISFHETKNIISGEGGCILINRPEMVAAAEIIREKGTDRSRFFRGEVDKYTWQSVGSSYLPGELVAAFLTAQLEQADLITTERLELWNRYHTLIEPLESEGKLRRPIIPEDCMHNGHIYYVLLPQDVDRDKVLADLKRNEIGAVFHYVPLHSSPAGQRYGRVSGEMRHTDDLAARLVRLPLWSGISVEQQMSVVDALRQCI